MNTRFVNLSIFIVGAACMTVAGYFLIEGLSQFSGGDAAKRMLIIGGILFQITESICFVSSAALTQHSLSWRVSLFSLGVVLFSFSIGVMTLAQKTAIQTGESDATAIDEKRQNIRDQIASLQSMIDSYRLNSEKQSQSIYKDSRRLGQDSLNRATQLEAEKLSLSNELFTLNQSRRETSLDFFKRFEEVTGLEARSTEFYFLFLRSLLLELSGIILMSFGAHLFSLRNEKQVLNEGEVNPQFVASSGASTELTRSVPDSRYDEFSSAKRSAIKPESKPVKEHSSKARSANSKNTKREAVVNDVVSNIDQALSKPSSHWASPFIRHLREQMMSDQPEDGTHTSVEDELAELVFQLYERKMIQSVGQDVVKDALITHYKREIDDSTASRLSKIVSKRIQS